nr:hypothetical protein [Tanacetum cinerariifolium]
MLGRNRVNTYAIRNTELLSGIEDSRHVPSDAMHNPSQSLKVRRTLFQNSRRFTHFYQLSHSELVSIQKVALSSSLRSLNQKASDYDNSGPAPKLQEVFPPPDKIDTSLKELELLFSPMKTTLIKQQMHGSYARFKAYEFIDPFAPPGTEVVESSSHNVDTSNMHTFYQRYHYDYNWTKANLLEQVRGNPSKLVKARRQLATDP